MVLLYDGDCGFCTASARWLVRHAEPAVAVRPWQGEPRELTDPLASQLARSVVLIGDDGVPAAFAGAAVAAVLRSSGRGWAHLAGGAMALPVLRQITELVYRLVAINRHRLPGSTAACATPNPP